MKNRFPRGSEWRKWDLHIHTPASFHWNGGKRFRDMTDTEKRDVLKRLVEKINQSDVEVFGIMDYWTFEGYFALTQFLEENQDIICNKTILPGMELRVEAPVDFRLNIHVLLSNKLSRQYLEDFKASLLIRIGTNTRPISDEALIEFAKTLDSSKAKHHGYNNYLTDESECLELGSRTAEIIRDCLQNAQLTLPEGSCLIILPYDTSNGLLKLDWKNHPQADNYFMQSAHIFETRSFENIDLFLGIETETNKEYLPNFIKTMGGKPKPVVSGSDAHKIDDYGNYPNDKATWIKSDPSFDGLKYTIYDPSERVRITPNDPSLEFPKPYFQKITIQDAQIFSQTPDKKIKFTATNLDLNSGLVAIIGGRGTGKSILLDAIAKTFNKPKNEDRTEEISMQEGCFSVTYAKNTGETEQFEIGGTSKVIYLHVHQREVQNIVKDPKFLSKAISDMLGISSVEENSLNDEEDIDDILRQIKECQDWLFQHDKNNSQSIIDSRTQLISTITTEKNKQIIDKYIDNISLITTKEKHINKLSGLSAKLDRITTELNNEIQEINNELEESSISTVNFKEQVESIKTIISSLTASIKNLKDSNDQDKESLAKTNIEGDPTTLWHKVDQYRSEIEKEQETIGQINDHQNKLESLINKRNIFVDQLDKRLKGFVDHINKKWSEKLQDTTKWDIKQKELIEKLLEPIKIYGEIYFDIEEFYKQLESCLDSRKFRSTQNLSSLDRVKSTIQVNSYEDYKLLIGNQPIIKLEQKLLTLDKFLEQDYFNQDGSDKFLSLLFSEAERKKYLNVLARIKYDNKSPEELSIGQRGTLYLRLKLATDPFFDPIVIDQPEDDLDNNFIMKDLVPIFLTIKKYRQVIIVTHNANLVVNADAEQVIIAQNQSESLSYCSGSLENPEIRERICDVLEGGKEAFIKREQKYGFK